MRLIVGANFLLVLLTIGGLVARYVPPHRCWWLQVLAIGLPVLGGGLLVVGLTLLRGCRWGAALNVVLVLVVGVRLVSIGPLTRRVPSSGLRVITHNAGGLENAAPSSYDGLRDLFEAADPDIVAWQERQVRRVEGLPGAAALPNRFQDILQAVQHRFPALPSGGVWVEEPVSTSLEAEAQQVLELSSQSREEQPGGATRVQMVWEGQAFALYNVHLHSFNQRPQPASHMAWLHPKTWRETLSAMRVTFLQQEEEAVRLRHQLQEEPLPLIVCGDLNSTPNNWVYAYLVRHLQDVFRQAGRGWGGTYNARFPFFRIDFIFASQEWEVHSARVMRTQASDHLPVLAELALRPRTEPLPDQRRAGR